MRVSLANSKRSFSVATGQSVLEAALSAGLNVPHSCKGGNCGSCRARLLDGDVEYRRERPLGLSGADAAQGFVLLCQVTPTSDLCIEVVEVATPDQITVKRLPCRIEKTVRLSHDVMAVYLRLPVAERFAFEAGQYIDVLLPGGRRRSFSIASPPHNAQPLELHVRHVVDGEFTSPLFAEPLRSTLLSIEGPLGQFVYRPSSAPMLLVGGGTGYAPLKSILRHVLENQLPRELTVYWGVRAAHDLYAHAELVQMAKCTQIVNYVPVLSEPLAGWQGRRGWVHEAVLEDFPDLARYDIYASGPPAMIEVVRREFSRRGCDPERLYFDSFDYASDTLERQRKMADNSS